MAERERERIAEEERQKARREHEEARRMATATTPPIPDAAVGFMEAPKATILAHAATTGAEIWGGPTLTLGAINARLGFTVSEEFLARLGFAATRIQSAKCYHEIDWRSICAQISRHVLAAADGAKEAA